MASRHKPSDESGLERMRFTAPTSFVPIIERAQRRAHLTTMTELVRRAVQVYDRLLAFQDEFDIVLEHKETREVTKLEIL